MYISIKMMQVKILKAWLKKWRKKNDAVVPCGSWERCYPWGFTCTSSSMPEDEKDSIPSSMHEYEKDSIPKDVPKGHLVVYVGENQRRFVIKLKLLKHPLFSTLLDQAREEYDFTADSRLYIPCDEDVFLSVVGCAASLQDRRTAPCL